jgi:hypothetical protein
MLIIEFLLVVTSLLSISSTLSALLLADISVASGGVRGEPFEVLVTVVGVRELWTRSKNNSSIQVRNI